MLFKQEKLIDIYDELLPIIERHYLEVSHYQDIELDIDEESYFKIDRLKLMNVYTARTDEGELIGYASYFIKHNLHYIKSLQAVQDAIYIKKENRGFGKSFIDWCDSQLREEGVQVVYHHVKNKLDFGPMLESLGYENIEKIYGRRLDRG